MPDEEIIANLTKQARKWPSKSIRLLIERLNQILAERDPIDEMTGQEFERHVMEHYKREGYKVKSTPVTGDQGIDILIEREGRRIGIQCKRWTDPVGNGAIQEAHAGKGFYDCHEVLVVCSSSFTHSAIELARKLGVRIIDREEFLKLSKLPSVDSSRATSLAEHVAVSEQLYAWVTKDGACERCVKLARGGPYRKGAIPTFPGSRWDTCFENCRCEIQLVE